MEFSVTPNSTMGAAISHVDVLTLQPNDIKQLLELVYEHKLVVVKHQKLDRQGYVTFSRLLGTPQVYPQANYHHPDFPEIFVSSNVPENGKKVGVSGTGRYWHTDCQFLGTPLPLTTLLPQICAGGRATEYIDMVAVYEALPHELRELVDGRDAIHEGKWRYKIQEEDIDRALIDILEEKGKLAPAVRHPAVITHPVTGKRALYISSGFTVALADLSSEESAAGLNALISFIEKPEHLYKHLWEEGDLLIWDNRVTVHRSSELAKGEKSVSYRIGVYDDKPFYR
ncbi:TauD/TfdA family dioxygenase [Pseudomonas sp. dw_612]|uniref:TauD/TfdA dioxygenase family protein n=1 Tax=Pseudomonas sp. dw_612 TaxID=2720080 RepID=UPI002116FB01|nr:TauD/TfdA family dioxygenase [Pseudomonas sp. dw_612]